MPSRRDDIRAAEIYWRMKYEDVSASKLAEKYDCSKSTILRRKKEFENLVEEAREKLPKETMIEETVEKELSEDKTWYERLIGFFKTIFGG